MRILFITLLSTIGLLLFGQAENYEIQVLSKTVGKGTSALITKADGTITYNIKSNASAKVFFKQHSLITDMNVNYKEGRLMHIKFDKIYNGEQEITEIKYENGFYIFYNPDGTISDVEKEVKFTSTEMFFKEPIGINEVYVERLNAFTPIEKIGDGEYRTKVDGNVNVYTYKNGELVRFKIKAMVNIYMNKV